MGPLGQGLQSCPSSELRRPGRPRAQAPSEHTRVPKPAPAATGFQPTPSREPHCPHALSLLYLLISSDPDNLKARTASGSLGSPEGAWKAPTTTLIPGGLRPMLGAREPRRCHREALHSRVPVPAWHPPRPTCSCRPSPLLGLGPGLAHQVSRTPHVGFSGAIETWLHLAGRAGSWVGSVLQAPAAAPLPKGPGCTEEACSGRSPHPQLRGVLSSSALYAQGRFRFPESAVFQILE